MKFDLFVIRPYPTKIRTIIFSALEALGAQFKDEWIAQPELSDAEVLHTLSDLRPDVLLCPFNPHHDKHGTEVHGVGILEKMHDEHLIKLPVIMPVTSLGKPRCKKLLEQSSIKHKDLILLVDQTCYEGDHLEEYIKAHLERLGL